jgi:hypothetical protein
VLTPSEIRSRSYLFSQVSQCEAICAIIAPISQEKSVAGEILPEKGEYPHAWTCFRFSGQIGSETGSVVYTNSYHLRGNGASEHKSNTNRILHYFHKLLP